MSAQPQQRVETEVVWLVNLKGDPPVVGFHHSHIIIFPSNVGQNSPASECFTRSESVSPGTLEKCVLFLNPGGRSYVAYPVRDVPALNLPGATTPIELNWEENTQQVGCIATLFLDAEQSRYVRVFPAGNSPHNPPGSANWSETPRPGETHLCLVQYVVVATGNVVGYAYPFIGQEVEIEVHRGLVHIGDIGVFIPCEIGWQVHATREGDKVHIVLDPSRE